MLCRKVGVEQVSERQSLALRTNESESLYSAVDVSEGDLARESASSPPQPTGSVRAVPCLSGPAQGFRSLEPSRGPQTESPLPDEAGGPRLYKPKGPATGGSPEGGGDKIRSLPPNSATNSRVCTRAGKTGGGVTEQAVQGAASGTSRLFGAPIRVLCQQTVTGCARMGGSISPRSRG
jgi:hypothetical protein